MRCPRCKGRTLFLAMHPLGMPSEQGTSMAVLSVCTECVASFKKWWRSGADDHIEPTHRRLVHRHLSRNGWSEHEHVMPVDRGQPHWHDIPNTGLEFGPHPEGLTPSWSEWCEDDQR